MPVLCVSCRGRRASSLPRAQARLHRVLPQAALLAQASDAVLPTSAWRPTLLLVRSFARDAAPRRTAGYYDLG